MGTFWRAMAGSFAGKILAGSFIALCLALGFGPDRWAEFMIAELPSWWTPSLARTIFLALAAITALVLVRPTIRAWNLSQTMSRFKSIEALTPTAQAQSAEPQRAKIGIKNVVLGKMYSDDDPVVSYELENHGEMAASGLVHRVWYENRPELAPRGEGQEEIIEPKTTTRKERHLLKPHRDVGSSWRHSADWPVVEDEEWRVFYKIDLARPLIGISVVYWDGMHQQRETECHYRYNPDGGTWKDPNYHED